MYITVHPLIAALPLQGGLVANNVRMLSPRSPVADNVKDAAEALGAAANKRVDKLAPESKTKPMRLNYYTPAATDGFMDDMKKALAYGSHVRAVDPETGKHIGSTINVNPNTHREYLAHELGHHVSDQTKMGNLVRNLRSNPKLAKSLAVAGGFLGVPFIQSALQEGDDDMLEGIAIASLLNAPTLIDEALATKHGLAIMKDAGMPATMGQRGRLAGGYLSYASVPILAGMMGNALGNVADDYTAVYDL